MPHHTNSALNHSAPPRRRSLGHRLSVAGLLAVGLLVSLPAAQATAQTPAYKREPYDIVYIKGREGGDACYPLKLANRYVSPLPKTGDLTLALVNPRDYDPPGEVKVPWRLVEQIDLFESQVLREVLQVVEQKRYDEAFDYYEFLQTGYPDLPGLKPAIQDYLYLSAVDLASKEQYPEALSTLEELFRRNPDYKNRETTVSMAVSSISDRLLGSYVGADKIPAARDMLRRLTKQYGTTRLPATSKWVGELSRRASGLRDQLRAELATGKLREAWTTSQDMLRIWPDVEGGRELALEAARRYPIVHVGVVNSVGDLADDRRIEDWHARRRARLQGRQLVEYVEPGPAGAQYQSPFGRMDQADDLSGLFIQLNQPKEGDQPLLNAYQLADRLLTMAIPGQPGYSVAWASLAEAVEVDGVFNVEVQLRRANVLPEALLQVPPSSGQQPEHLVPYRVAAPEEGVDGTQVVRRLVNPRYAFRGATQPAELIEHNYGDSLEAFDMLRAGKLDIIDRLQPADAAQLLKQPPIDYDLHPYALPTVHVLIPRLDHPYLARESFRRAMLYATPRDEILQKVVLEGRELPGAKLISGPFPSMSYAYNEEIAPPTFDLKLAKLLTLIALNELQQIAEQTKEQPPAYQPIVVGHPATKTARVACTAMAAYWNAVGIGCQLRELPPGETRDTAGACDVVYMELMVPEPLVDADRLVGAEGLAQSRSPYSGLALRRVNSALDWREAAVRMQELHRQLAQETTVLPLWELPEYYVVRKGVRGVGRGAISLYQNVERWLVEPLLLVE